jgi:chemotaxis methyl-accepting protein methylase
VIKLFARSLVPDGYLFLGHSESLIDRTSEFEPVVDGSVIYRKAASGP